MTPKINPERFVLNFFLEQPIRFENLVTKTAIIESPFHDSKLQQSKVPDFEADETLKTVYEKIIVKLAEVYDDSYVNSVMIDPLSVKTETENPNTISFLVVLHEERLYISARFQECTKKDLLNGHWELRDQLVESLKKEEFTPTALEILKAIATIDVSIKHLDQQTEPEEKLTDE